MALLGRWVGGAKSQGNLPKSWTAPTNLFDTLSRNDSSTYGWAASTSTFTLPSSGLADGYLFIARYEYHDTSNGRFNPQGKFVQASGTGNFVGGPAGGYSRDNSEDRSYVSCWAFVDSPSASATFQFQWKADTDDATGGTQRSSIEVIPLYYADIGMYSSTDAGLLGGTTPNVVGSWSTTLEGTNITRSSSVVSVTGDNKRYLILASQFFEGRGGRTQRWHGLDIDGSEEHAAKAYSYYRSTSNDESGDMFTHLLETSTATVTIEQTCYRGIGVSNGQGGASVDGSTPGVGDHALVVIELNDSAECFHAVDDTGGQTLATTGPVDINLCRTTGITFNDSASWTRANDTQMQAEFTGDSLLGVNLAAASENVSTGSRWTAYAELTAGGTENANLFAGDYLRNNQTSQDTFGWSANLMAFAGVLSGSDYGCSITELSGSEGGGDAQIQAGWAGFWGINLDTLEDTGASVDVSAVSAATSIVAPDRVDQTVDVPAVSASTGIVAPSVGAGAVVAVAAIAATLSILAPDRVDQTVAVPSIAVATAVPTPEATRNWWHIGATQEDGWDIGAVQHPRHATHLIYPDVPIAAELGIVAPTVERSVDVPAVPVASSVVAPDRVDQTVDVDAVGVASSVLAPTIGAAQEVDVPAVSAALSVVAPDRVDQTVDVPATAAATSIVAPTVIASQAVDVPAIPAALSIVATDRVDQTVAAPATSAALSILPPEVDQTVAVPVIPVASAIVAPDVTVSQAVDVPQVPAALSIVAPDRIDQTVAVPAIPVATSVAAIDVRFDLDLDVPAIPAALGVVAPDRVDQTVDVPAIPVASSVAAPTIPAGVVVPQVSAALSVLAPDRIDQTVIVPAVSASTAVIAPDATFAVDVPATSAALSILAPSRVDQTVVVPAVSVATAVAAVDVAFGQTVDVPESVLASSILAPARVDRAAVAPAIPVASSVAAPDRIDQTVVVPSVPLSSAVVAPAVPAGDQTVDVPAISAATSVGTVTRLIPAVGSKTCLAGAYDLRSSLSGSYDPRHALSASYVFRSELLGAYDVGTPLEGSYVFRTPLTGQVESC